jgi:hypothetical protein
MNRRLSRSAPFAVAMLAAALVAAVPAQAVTITPAGTAVSATNVGSASFTYGGNPFTCSGSSASGTTTSPATDTLNLTTAFSGCGFYYGTPTIVTSGPVSLKATSAFGSGNGGGSLTLPSGSSITITDRVFGIVACTVSIVGPQTDATGWSLDALNDRLTLDASLSATRSGSPACGPASGSIGLLGTYAVSPANLAVN